MDPHGPTAQRFPLVACFRPACLPLLARVRGLTDLAASAARKVDQGLASASSFEFARKVDEHAEVDGVADLIERIRIA